MRNITDGEELRNNQSTIGSYSTNGRCCFYEKRIKDLKSWAKIIAMFGFSLEKGSRVNMNGFCED